MVEKQILITLLNNIKELGAYDIEVSYQIVTFCTPLDKEPEVFNIFGFCVYRLKSYNYQTHRYYVIQ